MEYAQKIGSGKKNKNEQAGGSAQLNSYSSGAGGGGATPQIDHASIALFDQAMGQANKGLGRLDNQLAIATSNVNNDYTTNLNRLLGAKARTERDYTQNKDDTTKDNMMARSDIDFQTGQRANSLQRLLGARGAGNSSAARTAAPYAAALEGTQQLNQVGDAFAGKLSEPRSQ